MNSDESAPNQPTKEESDAMSIELQICNKLRQWRLVDVQKKLEKWGKKDPDFIQKMNLFFTK